ALGLDTSNAVFYRQSDVPEIPELCWVLSCVTAKGLMNRAHAYKASVAENEEAGGNDPDKGINMGLFGYPILMAADMLMFKANQVPVGKDQIQHIEMARDIASRFNHIYGEHFAIPEAVVDDNAATILGLDGRKMSKSYNNTIPLFETEKKFKKLINKIKTNSLEPGEPKDPDGCTLFGIYKAFSREHEVTEIRQRYAEGIAWGEMKKVLFEKINEEIAPARERYQALMEAPEHIEEQLQDGAAKAREISIPFMQEIRESVGISHITK
ncbi:MAG: tryptophan--tRNA ligase, partial [Methylococcales bacterium]|nr:tryptophan--tRNA ligase [Methylococcales bacterium]